MNTEIILGSILITIGVAMYIYSEYDDPIESAPIEYTDRELADCACDVARLGEVTAIAPEVRCSQDHDLPSPLVQREGQIWHLCRNGTPAARLVWENREAEREAQRVIMDAELQRMREAIRMAREGAEDATP